MRFRRILATVLAVCVSSHTVHAQAPANGVALVDVTVAPETVTVGQPFSVRVRVRAPKFATIRFPAVPDTADNVEAVDPRAIEDAGDTELIDRTAIYRFVAWDVGHRAPHFADVSVESGGSTRQYAVTAPGVTVESLLPADTAKRKPKDLRDPIAPPSALWKILLIAGVLLAGLVWYWWWRRTRRKHAIVREPDPFVAAVRAFDALDLLALPAAGEPGRHVIASVDVLRGYLARRFPDMRESLTAQEIERTLPGSDLPVLPERLSQLLQRESSLRFARAEITADEALALGKESRAVVHDIQTAYEVRVRAMERGPQRARRR